MGGTAWLPSGVVALALKFPRVAAWWLACFAGANLVGTGLWMRRDRLRPYPAIHSLVATFGLAGLLAVTVLHAFGPGEIPLGIAWREGRIVLENSPGGTLRTVYALLLLGVPTLMGYFAPLERMRAPEGSRDSTA